MFWLEEAYNYLNVKQISRIPELGDPPFSRNLHGFLRPNSWAFLARLGLT